MRLFLSVDTWFVGMVMPMRLLLLLLPLRRRFSHELLKGHVVTFLVWIALRLESTSLADAPSTGTMNWKFECLPLQTSPQ